MRWCVGEVLQSLLHLYNLGMSSIADLPTTPQFTIKTVCAQTGIRAVTLRAWERRYQVFTPQRTAGNYRLYSERDIAIVRWLKRRVDDGLAISAAVSELSQNQQRGVWPEPVLPPQPPLLARSATPPATYAQRLFLALTTHDETAAAAVLREAHALFDITAVCLGILTPCMVAIGEGWHRGEVRIATEHFATTYVRGRVMALFQAFSTARHGPRILVGCAPDERHDVGALMLSLLLRRESYRVEYLGADVNLEDLIDYSRDEHPALICLSAASRETARNLQRFQATLTMLRRHPKFGFGGRAFVADPQLRAVTPGVYLGDTAAEALERVGKILKRS